MSKIIDNLRYSEKRYLSKYDLYVDLFKIFNLKVIDLVPLRNVFIIFTDKGKKILKKIDYSLEELNYIYEATKYIKLSFPRVLDLNKTSEGKLYAVWKGDIYCIIDMMEGRESEYSNPIDICTTAKGIGQLHKAGEGFRYNLKERNLVGKAKDIFIRKYEEMNFFKNLATMHEIKTEFDEIFLSNINYYIKEMKKSIQAIEATSYLKVCSEEDKITICHHDLAHHNILIQDDEAYFIDFDYSVIDLKVHDLSNFINKAIKNNAYDFEKAEQIIENYCIFNTLAIKEKEILYAFLCFPEDFYSISKDYYTRRKDWEEEVFLDRLNKKISFMEDREEFLNEFKNYVTKG